MSQQTQSDRGYGDGQPQIIPGQEKAGIQTDQLERLAKGLAAGNAGAAFGVSGSGNSFKLISYLMDNGVPYYPMSHEASAAIAAGAFTFLSGRTGLSISIKGPGFANMLPGMAANFMERYGAIALSEGYDDEVSVKKMHKRLEQFPVLAPMAGNLSSLNSIGELDIFLHQQKGNEMPGFFELSYAKIPIEVPVYIVSERPLEQPEFDQYLLDFLDARRPVLIVGSLVRRLGIDISHLNLPIFTSVQGKGVLSESAANACGIYTGAGKDLAAETSILKAADCIITVGLRNFEILGVDGKPEFLNFDIPHRFITEDDIAISEKQVHDLIASLANHNNWAKELIAENKKALASYVESYDWMPGNIFNEINQLSYDHVVVLDTGSFCTIGEHIWECKAGRSFIGSSNGRNLGLSIPTAIGASLAKPGQPVFCAVGDGGIRYYVADIRTIAEHALPVCILYMSDGRYGSIISNLPGFKTNDIITTPSGNNWIRIVEAMGIPSCQINSLTAFRQQFDGWDQQSPLFLQCEFEPEAYLSVTIKLR